MTKVYIYTLSEEGSDEVKYVGRTVSPGTRLIGHFKTDDLSESHPKRSWIEGVKSNNGKVAMSIIDECDQSEAGDREQQWIDRYSDQGAKLTNVVKAAKSKRVSSDTKNDNSLLVSDDSSGKRDQAFSAREEKLEKRLEYQELLLALLSEKIGLKATPDLSPGAKLASMICAKTGMVDDAIRFLMKDSGISGAD